MVISIELICRQQTRFQQPSVSYTDSIRTNNRIKFWPRAISEQAHSHIGTRVPAMWLVKADGVCVWYTNNPFVSARARIYAKHTHTKAGFRTQHARSAAANQCCRRRQQKQGNEKILSANHTPGARNSGGARIGFWANTEGVAKQARRRSAALCVCFVDAHTQCTNTAAEIACNDTNSQ